MTYRILPFLAALLITAQPVRALAGPPPGNAPERLARSDSDPNPAGGIGSPGSPFKDPRAFIEWIDAFIQPRFMTALGTVSTDAGPPSPVLANGIDPNTARNAAELTDPHLCLRWLLAGREPAAGRAILRKPGSALQSRGVLDPEVSPAKADGHPPEKPGVRPHGPAEPATGAWLYLPARAGVAAGSPLRY